jgi:hypothetical protein
MGPAFPGEVGIMKLRSVGAVVAGILFIVVVTTLVDEVLHIVGVYAPWGQALDHGDSAIALSYRLVIGILGGWLTARLAPRNPIRHVVTLGLIGTAMAALGLMVTWNLDLGPHWYPISLVVTGLPLSWLGGKLYERRRPSWA